MTLNSKSIPTAIAHVRDRDPVLAGIIDRVGPFTLKPTRDRFAMLVRSILSQQISTKAARTIRERVEQLVAPGKMTAEALAKLSIDQLRSAGVSAQKAGYLHDLAAKVADGTVRLPRVGRMSDDEVIAELVQVKGVGHWTAQMFLIFSLARPNVFPHADLGIRSALRTLYELDELPDRTTGEAIAECWQPYATVASWYCWRSLELPKE